LDNYKKELNDLEVRQKVGELTPEGYRKASEGSGKKILRLQDEIQNLKKLKEAESVNDIQEAAPTPTGGREPHGTMTVSDIFSKSYEIYKTNPIMVVPTLIPIVWSILGSIFLIGGFMSAISRAYMYDSSGIISTLMWSAFVFMIGFLILLVLAEGVTIDMISDAYGGGRANLSKSVDSAKLKIAPLLVASIAVGFILSIGYMLFVIPGLILTLLLYFVAQAIMIDDMGAKDALIASYNFAKSNLADSIVIVLASIAILVVLSIIPLLGIILVLVALPYLIALPTLLYIDRR